MSTAATVVIPRVKYNVSIGYLRGFLVALVVAHHAVLPYHPYAPTQAPVSLLEQPRFWAAFPVVDSGRWSGFLALVGFNDIFFMALMFFLSGLFVWQGLKNKGAGKFVRGRLLRLGLPFVVAASVLAPLAYYPMYLQTASHTGFAGFWREWLALGQWPAGPAWFIWVLLAFDCVAALLFTLAPHWGEALGRFATPAWLVGFSAIAYIPLAMVVSPLAWSAVGPFAFQTSRIVHYLVYFLVGVGVGAAGIERGWLAPDGKLARHWLRWAGAALTSFGVTSVVAIVAITSHAESQAWAAAMDAGFVLTCAAASFACLAVFQRFAQSRSKRWDSLSANSYGIYLVHYAIVSWLQYALVPAALPGFAKGLLVFAGALGLSWAVAATLRRIPAVARVV